MHQSKKTADLPFSLTLVLHDILRRLGCDYDVDDLHALMGLPMLVCAPRSKRCETPWPLLGRDAALLEAAHAVGLTIRGLHPPEAARDLCQANEFCQHFEASYLPLVERALENNQPVIAWQGWTGDSLGLWGAVTAVASQGIGLLGCPYPVPGENSPTESIYNQPMPLTRAPVQLYVIESADGVPLSSNALLRSALENARLVHSPDRANRFDVFTGVAAYDHFLEAMQKTDGPSLDALWSDYASSIVAGHAAGLRFFERQISDIDTDLQETVAALCYVCEAVIQSLEGLTPDTPLSVAIDQVKFAQQHTTAMLQSLAGVAEQNNTP